MRRSQVLLLLVSAAVSAAPGAQIKVIDDIIIGSRINDQPLIDVKCENFKSMEYTEHLIHISGANNRKFYVKPVMVTWFKAHEWCISNGMQMPMLKNLSEVESVAKRLKEINDARWVDFWLAASNINKTNKEGTWRGRLLKENFRWTDGTPVDTSMWQPERPYRYVHLALDQGSGVCIYFYIDSGRLCDARCDQPLALLICEIPAEHTSCFDVRNVL